MDSVAVLENFIVERSVTGEFRTRLESFAQVTRDAVGQLVVAFRPSGNALREVLLLAEEIARRDGLTLESVLEKSELKNIVARGLDDAQGSNRKELFKQYKQQLIEWRYPEVTRIREKVATLEQRLKSQYGAQLELPPELEGDKIKLTISGRSVEEVLAQAEKLVRLAHSEDLKSLFQTLKGYEC